MLYTFSKRIVVCLMTLFILAGCQKDEDDDPSRTEILTSGQWRITGITANPAVVVSGIPISDIYAFLPACSKDNYYVFKTDGNAELNEGPTKCNAADPQTQTQTWALSSDEQQITINATSFTVLGLTDTELRVSGPFTYPGVGSTTAEITFGR